MAISDPGRGLVRRLGVTAAALFAFAAASQQRAEALSLASPGTAPAAKFATDGLTTEVRHGGHGRRRWISAAVEAAVSAAAVAVSGGGFRGGGFHGGGFRGGGAAFHGGGFRGGWRSTAAAFAPRPCSAAAVFARRRSSVAAAIATDIATPITGRISITTGSLPSARSTRRPITAIRVTMATGTATAA